MYFPFIFGFGFEFFRVEKKGHVIWFVMVVCMEMELSEITKEVQMGRVSIAELLAEVFRFKNLVPPSIIWIMKWNGPGC